MLPLLSAGTDDCNRPISVIMICLSHWFDLFINYFTIISHCVPTLVGDDTGNIKQLFDYSRNIPARKQISRQTYETREVRNRHCNNKQKLQCVHLLNVWETFLKWDSVAQKRAFYTLWVLFFTKNLEEYKIDRRRFKTSSFGLD